MATLCLLALHAGPVGCSDDEPADGAGASQSPSPDPASQGGSGPPTAAEAMAMPRGQLVAALERASRRARRHAASSEGVAAARTAARLARVLALRDDDSGRLEQARELLREASRRKALAGACEAAVELARLEAVDGGNLAEAYAIAYRTTRRFSASGPGEHAERRRECLAEARRLTSVLHPYRPGVARLAAIDADPNAGDPTADGTADEAVDVAAWAANRADVEPGKGPPSTLKEISVYGARAQASGSAEADDDGRGVVRVVLRFDGVAVFERGELSAEGELPRRAYLDLERTRLGNDVSSATAVGAGGLRRVRTGRRKGQETRVVFDLEHDARYRLFFLTDPYRIVVDFERGGAPAAGDGGEAPVIVLDPGHGGRDTGAEYEDLDESVLVLDIAERLERALERRLPKSKVLLTRRKDVFISLEQRTAMANAAEADVFVSLHLNAADQPVDHGGIATFVLDTSGDRQAVRLAARENDTTPEEVTGLQRILAGLHRERQATRSRALARHIQRNTLASARRMVSDLTDRGVKEALFYVLVGARMPAVLLEASFLTHPREARMLRSGRYRQRLAEGAADGLVAYLRDASAGQGADGGTD